MTGTGPGSDEPMDAIRRKLLRSGAIAGGALVLGQLPYQRPGWKSFYGTRAAWAQGTAPAPGCGIVAIVPLSRVTAAPADKKFSVTNTGGVPFVLTDVTSSNPVFVVTDPKLPLSLAPGAAVEVTVQVNCTAAGNQTGTLTVITDILPAPAGCASIDVSADCPEPCEVAPNPIDFGDVLVGDTASETLTVTNNVNFALEITAISFDDAAFTTGATVPLTIDPGAAAQIPVDFACSEAGTVNGELTLTVTSAFGDINCPPVPLTGNCVALGCEVNPTALDFGNVPVGDTPTLPLTISNTGTVDFDVTDISSDDAAFSVLSPPSQASPLTVPAGGSVDVDVQFDCATDGTFNGNLTITTTSAFGPVTCPPVPLSGVCELTLTCEVNPDTLMFTGFSAPNQFVTITNAGTATFTVDELNIVNVSDPGAIFFFLVNETAVEGTTLNPGDSVMVEIEFGCEGGAGTAELEIVASSTAGVVTCPTVALSGDCSTIQ